MEYGKYIIVEERGHEVAIVFDSLIQHNSFSSVKIISAGFFRIEIIFDSVLINYAFEVITFGESISLKLKPRKEDAALITKILKE